MPKTRVLPCVAFPQEGAGWESGDEQMVGALKEDPACCGLGGWDRSQGAEPGPGLEHRPVAERAGQASGQLQSPGKLCC